MTADDLAPGMAISSTMVLDHVGYTDPSLPGAHFTNMD